tara:strand:+ start:4303 stop:4692 length:390 start_codon:yes stop_codon:yes gene_type:complete
METLGISLCNAHIDRIEKIIKTKHTPLEAVQLYYALKKAGLHPTLEWWDGRRSIDIAISRVKLNIEIESNYETISHEQAIKDLEEAMLSFKNGFTTIRIPDVLVKYHLKDTVKNLTGIVEGLKINLKAI